MSKYCVFKGEDIVTRPWYLLLGGTWPRGILKEAGLRCWSGLLLLDEIQSQPNSFFTVLGMTSERKAQSWK